MDNQPTEEYQDFASCYQLGEDLKNEQKKAVIIIGNTRSGKSTLACAGAGVQMSIQYTIGNQVFIRPDKLPYSDYVKNCNESVTKTPNFFAANPHQNMHAIIDMPGHADNSRLRELVNFHYIKTMASNFQMVRFLIVLNMQVKAGQYYLRDIEYRMIEAFVKMFPNCHRYVKIIVNKVDHGSDETLIKKFIREAIHISKSFTVRQYFLNLTDRDFFIIEKPKYRRGPNGQRIYIVPQYRHLNHKMKDICNNCEEKDFIALNPENFQRFSILEENNKSKIQIFQRLVEEFAQKSQNLIIKSLQIMRNSIILLVEGTMEDKKETQYKLEQQIERFLSAQKIIRKANRSLSLKAKDDNILAQSTVIQFIYYLKNIQFPGKEYQFVLRQYIDHLHYSYSQIYHLANKIFQSPGLNKIIMEFFVFLDRRLQQYDFFSNILKGKSKKYMESQHQIGFNIQQMNQFRSIQQHQHQFLKQIQNKYIELNIPIILHSLPMKHYDKLEKEIVKILRLIDETIDQDIKVKKQAKDMHDAIGKKIKQAQIQIVLHLEPHDRKHVNPTIEKLLNIYNDKEECKTKLKIIVKLAKLFERRELQKDAIVFYFYLFLNNEVMRLVENHIVRPAHSSKQKNQQALEWLKKLNQLFRANAHYNFARNCLEHGKKLAIDDPKKFLQFELDNFECAEQERKGEVSAKRKNILVENQQNYWDWPQISQQIEFQKTKWKISKNVQQSALKTNEPILQKYRNSNP